MKQMERTKETEVLKGPSLTDEEVIKGWAETLGLSEISGSVLMEYLRSNCQKSFSTILKEKGLKRDDVDDVVWVLCDYWFFVLPCVYVKAYSPTHLLIKRRWMGALRYEHMYLFNKPGKNYEDRRECYHKCLNDVTEKELTGEYPADGTISMCGLSPDDRKNHDLWLSYVRTLKEPRYWENGKKTFYDYEDILTL